MMNINRKAVMSAAILAALFVCSANAASRGELLRPVNRFYDWANNTYGVSGAKPAAPSTIHTNLERIFAPDIVHRLNGRVVASSVDDLYQRFLKLRDKYDYVLVDRPFKEVVVDKKNDKVAIRYQIRFHLKDGKSKQIYALTIFRIKNDQLVEFNEISSVANDHL